MSWVRIHDGALSHPKIVGLFKPTDPLHVWFWGLSYAQTHLTDGLIPSEALPHGSGKAVALLVLRKLWEALDDGSFQIHGYLEWNDSRVLVNKRRTEAKERMANARQRTSPEVLRGLVRSSVLSSDLPERESERKPNSGAAFRGGGAAAGMNPVDHLKHAACDETFSRCVPNAVHFKLCDLLAPKHGGDRQAAGAALNAWYPSVWASLPADFVMGEAFKFWQVRFDAAFASTDPGAPDKFYNAVNDDKVWADIVKAGVPK